jgi:hypothetical protein
MANSAGAHSFKASGRESVGVMMRRPLGLLAVTAALTLICGFSARPLQAEENLIWTARTSGGMVSLAFGSLDPDKNPLFLLTCLNEMNVSVLEIFGVIEGKRPGQDLTIEIAAGDKKVALPGKVELDDQSHAMFVEASEVEPRPVLDVLGASGDVTVTLGFTKKTLGDRGRAAALTQFSKDCEMVPH